MVDEQMLGRRPSRPISDPGFAVERLAPTGLLFHYTSEISYQFFFRVRKTIFELVHTGWFVDCTRNEVVDYRGG